MRLRSAVLGAIAFALTTAVGLPAQAAPGTAAGAEPSERVPVPATAPAGTPLLDGAPVRSVPGVPAATRAPVTWLHLRNGGTDGTFCLAVQGADNRPGTGLIQWGCAGNVDHWWAVEPWTYQDRVIYRVVSKNRTANDKQLCLSMPPGNSRPGTQAVQSECGNVLEHFWYFVERTGRGQYRVVNGFSGHCLAVEGNSHTAGAKVIQWPCKTDGSDRPDHLWHMTTT
ncbi:RICIN domain-containing protein [Streptomyces clavuligerus]|nr:RICIN domain-containing protein [Streptomyces clavuligerus]MBY6307274.1 RICIN domain-containing protein [Streptomyces clavuligerus]QPL67312.1 RICIN domain-containing protein [Streptomyces clavuligerus]QPL73176.1 RICIN domain-containing protein [Streptomyces clavuligerus]QPL79415.1 RICIN domain-containing protein [Streptomyces clavuligerus]QPL85280.1 RICIN domain-containing protein [Streptomyces clavuligerus]